MKIPERLDWRLFRDGSRRICETINELIGCADWLRIEIQRVGDDMHNAKTLIRSTDRKARRALCKLLDRVAVLEGKADGTIVDSVSDYCCESFTECVHQGKIEDRRHDDTGSFVPTAAPWWVLAFPDGPRLRIFKINHCPFCGKELS
jgi:hypothetical protein